MQMTTREVFGSKLAGMSNTVLDLVLIMVITFLVGAVCFNHAYFGDELSPFVLAAHDHGSFLKTLLDLSQYKPRVLFYAIWTAIAMSDAPRVVPMIINTTAFICIAWMIYYWAVARCGASRWVAWISVLAVLFCRFGMVLYFDYIAGIIETLSLTLFLLGVLVGSQREELTFGVAPLRLVLSVLLVIAAVFIYEPFIASAFAFALIVITDTLVYKGRKQYRLTQYIYAATLALFPIILFYFATKWLSILSINTGTDGRTVTLSFDNFKAFVIYFSNLFFGTNYGHPWLVGDLTLGVPGAVPIFIASAITLIAAYIYAVRDAMRNNRASLFALKWLLLVAAVIVVSSLPGTGRQEGRWMFPAFVFLIFTLLAAFSGKGRVLLLLVLLGLNGLYLFLGSQLAIYNVTAVRTASSISTSLQSIQPAGNYGVVIGLHDAAWIIGGNQFSGGLRADNIFARVNLGGSFVLKPFVNRKLSYNPAHYEFALVFTGRNTDWVPQFSLVTGRNIKLLLDPPEQIKPTDCEVIGGFGDWRNWELKNPAMLQATGVLRISPGSDGFRSLPVATLQHRVLAYMAHSEAEGRQPMRLQINWQDKSNVFLGASITVVEVGSKNEVYTTYVSPPAGAETGFVYASTHDGATGNIVIDAICLY